MPKAAGVTCGYHPGRDDATDEDIQRRDGKRDWPHYIRVHHATFIAGTVANGISLNRLMDELGPSAFASTEANDAAGAGNTNPRMSLRRQPHARLSRPGYAWLQGEFEAALAGYGRLPDADLARLDWPTVPPAA